MMTPFSKFSKVVKTNDEEDDEAKRKLKMLGLSTIKKSEEKGKGESPPKRNKKRKLEEITKTNGKIDFFFGGGKNIDNKRKKLEGGSDEE